MTGSEFVDAQLAKIALAHKGLRPQSPLALSLGLPIQRVLASPRFALSTILARNARAFHYVRGSTRAGELQSPHRQYAPTSLPYCYFLEVGGVRMARVAFIGLGVMGYPMAGHLRKKGGHDVTVYNQIGRAHV